MSRTTPHRAWGPSHQHIDPPRRRPGPLPTIAGLLVLFLLLAHLRDVLAPGTGLAAWLIEIVVAVVVIRVVLVGAIPLLLDRPRASPYGPKPTADVLALDRPPSPAALARARIARAGAGPFLGADERGAWVSADSQSAVMVLGPPRSGKTSAVIVPALMSCSGPAISTSTKPDVMRATLAARQEIGQAWLFDPSGEEQQVPPGVRRLSWSPVAAASTWDQALVMAKAMTAAARAGAGTTNESHWSERAAALLAPLLHAASVTECPVEEVLRWILRHDLEPATQALEDSEAHIAADVLAGIRNTESRERSSIFSATAGVLSAYNADAVRQGAARPNFDPERFARSTDTIYITAPEHKQALCAPLIVGLLEQVRRAVYHRARTEHPARPPMLWLLDEVANTAPIHDLPALVSQAGGQGLQVMVGLQDLSQARARWGQDTADGFLSLFQTKLVLSGIADSRTLESISLSLGEYDREMASQTLGLAEPDKWFATATYSDTVNYQTQRQRTLTPGEIAHLPPGCALLLTSAGWQLLGLTPWHRHQPWRTIALESFRSERIRK